MSLQLSNCINIVMNVRNGVFKHGGQRLLLKSIIGNLHGSVIWPSNFILNKLFDVKINKTHWETDFCVCLCVC